MELNMLYGLVVTLSILLKVEYITTGKICTLDKDPVGHTYLIKCEPSIPGRDRTHIQRKKEKRTKKLIRGPPGLPGVNGKVGPNGPEGPMGPTGPTGVPGRRGFTGPKGPAGEKGEIGSMGAQGTSGIPGNCIDDSKTKELTNKKKYHCIAGPMGPQGKRGSRGEPGAIGLRGRVGIKGEKGGVGPIGRRGAVGKPGLPGSPGIITCASHHTEWVGRFRHMDDKAIDGFFCPAGQFLQGFKSEKEGLKERYNYICCKLR